jgi:hypothetical protein
VGITYVTYAYNTILKEHAQNVLRLGVNAIIVKEKLALKVKRRVLWIEV